MTRLGRGLGALVAAVVLAVAGGLLVLDLAEANPPPGRVLAEARRFVVGAHSVRYVTDLTTDVPTTAGADLLRRRHVVGQDAFGKGWDYTLTEGPTQAEFLSTPALHGFVVRSASAPATLGSGVWTRFSSFAQLDGLLLSGGPSGGRSPGLDALPSGLPAGLPPGAVGQAVLADNLSGAEALSLLLNGARDPRRVAGRARHLGVAFDRVAAFPDQGGAVTDATGELIVDRSGRPQWLRVVVREGAVTMTMETTFARWDETVVVTSPAATAITDG